MSGFDPITSGIWLMNHKNTGDGGGGGDGWECFLFWLAVCAVLAAILVIWGNC